MKLTVEDGFPYYIELVGEKNWKEIYKAKESINLFEKIDEEKANYRFESGKWSIKQIVGHLTDHERIMTYRILRFSRKDETLLPGYDQETFIQNSNFEKIPFAVVLEDFKNVRNASISFINTLSEDQYKLKGKAWKYELTIEEFLKATIGHEMHHLNVLKEKYLRITTDAHR
ncbi:MAG TPA: DinB family protein [Leptospiraceae bacterium]|nr:DinB family protein [Leptospiraceae bacterium]HMW04405.1 DinB family protein [Leptospiraceae bacterium]HMY34119.1 DinB family protein [Leptospiraceae bacterium]HMZ63830.1 DinB family protein [Leptospiraceae bacterium]HNA10219.1 DinB family protein [Leptospiraceae bacterium]